MLLSRGKERESKPPLGNKKKILVKNLHKSPKPGVTIIGAKRGNSLIHNHQLNVPRGELDVKFKREIKV